MTVDRELEELRARIGALMDTRCADCAHPYRQHRDWNNRCAPFYRYGESAPKDAKPCRCKAFVDPSERLAVDA